jgi:acyl carrier protein
VLQTLYEYIRNNFPLARQRGMKTSDNLLENGIVESLGLLTIVEFMEATFGVSVKDQDVVEDNFRSIDTMAAYVARAKESKG